MAGAMTAPRLRRTARWLLLAAAVLAIGYLCTDIRLSPSVRASYAAAPEQTQDEDMQTLLQLLNQAP